MKVGGTKRLKKKLLVVPLHFLISTIGRFGERFRDGQYSLVSFLFAVLLTVPPRAQPSVKVGARPPVPHGVGATAHSTRPSCSEQRKRISVHSST